RCGPMSSATPPKTSSDSASPGERRSHLGPAAVAAEGGLSNWPRKRAAPAEPALPAGRRSADRPNGASEAKRVRPKLPVGGVVPAEDGVAALGKRRPRLPSQVDGRPARVEAG